MEHAGVYESAVLTMDFTTADVVVQDANGDGITADVLDENGAPAGVLQVRLNLTTSDVIRISANVPAAFSLDFDLDASNEIDLSTSPPTVTVQPFLLATPELDRDREHRVRGTLASIDETESVSEVDGGVQNDGVLHVDVRAQKTLNQEPRLVVGGLAE